MSWIRTMFFLTGVVILLCLFAVLVPLIFLIMFVLVIAVLVI